MFELLDHARLEVARKAAVKPRYAILVVLSALLVGVQAGMLIGKHDWSLLGWLKVGFYGIVFLVIFVPWFRELSNFLKDHEVN
jgi:hypothetical protein